MKPPAPSLILLFAGFIFGSFWGRSAFAFVEGVLDGWDQVKHKWIRSRQPTDAELDEAANRWMRRNP